VNLFNLILVLCTQLCAVTGQIFVKKAMTLPAGAEKAHGRTLLATGIASMSVGFFLWLGLMKKFDLSYLFPFEGLHYIFIIIAAAIFLRERASLNLWAGGILICTGIVLVSAS
jgi:drug/metabolite transporter (DMT)-like permease